MVGIAFNDVFDGPAVGVLSSFFAKVKNYGGALAVTPVGLNVVTFLAVAGPLPGCFLGGFTAYDLNFPGDHECRIKAYPKLAY